MRSSSARERFRLLAALAAAFKLALAADDERQRGDEPDDRELRYRFEATGDGRRATGARGGTRSHNATRATISNRMQAATNDP